MSIFFNVEEESARISQKFYDFSDDIRVLMLIDRVKGKTISQKISANKEDFSKIVTDLLRIKLNEQNTCLRIYSTVNSRCLKKAIRLFKHQQLDIDYADNDSQTSFYKNLSARFISSLTRPDSRKTKYFMLDLDSKRLDELLAELLKLEVKIVSYYESKKGWHIVTEPFNPGILKFEDCEIKKDAALLLHW